MTDNLSHRFHQSEIEHSLQKPRTLIIGVNGIAGAGKDTISNMVLLSLNKDHGLKTQCFAFADTLKKAASIIFNVPLEAFYDQNTKEIIIPYWNMSPRQMAQQLGTEACRKGIRDDIWIKSLQSTILASNADIAFITDVRFNNEAEFVKSCDGIIVNIVRNKHKTIETSSHDSEAGISENLIDFKIENITGNTFIAAAKLQEIILNELS